LVLRKVNYEAHLIQALQLIYFTHQLAQVIFEALAKSLLIIDTISTLGQTPEILKILTYQLFKVTKTTTNLTCPNYLQKYYLNINQKIGCISKFYKSQNDLIFKHKHTR